MQGPYGYQPRAEWATLLKIKIYYYYYCFLGRYGRKLPSYFPRFDSPGKLIHITPLRLFKLEYTIQWCHMETIETDKL